MKAVLAMVVVALALAGCAIPTDVDANFGEVFSLNVGQQAILEDGGVIRFVRVTEDSRCPEDAACAWEGNAEVLLELIEKGATPRPFTLNTHEPYGNEVNLQGYTISLYNLHPTQHTERTINPEDYIVELRVTR